MTTAIRTIEGEVRACCDTNSTVLISILFTLVALRLLRTASTVYRTLFATLILFIVIVTNLAVPDTVSCRVHETPRQALFTDVITTATKTVIHKVLARQAGLVVHHGQLVSLTLWQTPIQVEVVFGSVTFALSVDQDVVVDTGKAVS